MNINIYQYTSETPDSKTGDLPPSPLATGGRAGDTYPDRPVTAARKRMRRAPVLSPGQSHGAWTVTGLGAYRASCRNYREGYGIPRREHLCERNSPTCPEQNPDFYSGKIPMMYSYDLECACGTRANDRENPLQSKRCPYCRSVENLAQCECTETDYPCRYCRAQAHRRFWNTLAESVAAACEFLGIEYAPHHGSYSCPGEHRYYHSEQKARDFWRGFLTELYLSAIPMLIAELDSTEPTLAA